jgi:hypothetical protein
VKEGGRVSELGLSLLAIKEVTGNLRKRKSQNYKMNNARKATNVEFNVNESIED